MKRTASDAEATVRQYLLYLEDPSRLIDQTEVKRLEKAVATSADPIDKLRALADLARARQVDGEAYEQGFIRVARQWADDNGIPADMFEELGVPARTLRTAGFAVPARSARRRSRAHASGGSSMVTARDIKAHIETTMGGIFTMGDIASTIGGSPMTVRKAFEELLRAGTITKLGPTPNWSRPGRAPIQFTKPGR